MSEDDAELTSAVAAHGGGPTWQAVAVGDRVTPLRGRKQGVVTEIVKRSRTTGITTHVGVSWRTRPAEVWPTDFLTIVRKQGEITWASPSNQRKP